MCLQKFLQLACSIYFILCLTACTSVGTVLLPKNREGFNAAMITSEEQQLLLNLVRLVFEDRPNFMSVESITTSNSLAVSGGMNYGYSPSISKSSNYTNLGTLGQLTPDSDLSVSHSFSLGNALSFSPSANYSDSPTVSFQPLQGERFTRQMLSPISLSTLVLLLKAGWGAGKILRISVEWMDKLFNESRMHSRGIPNNKPFVDFVNDLRQLNEDNMIYFELGEITQVSID